MKHYFFLFIIFLGSLYGKWEEIDVAQDLRIQKLMPKEGLFVTLGIEPAIPENFVALSKNGEIDYVGKVYWGSREVLEAYFKNPKSLSEPIIEVFITPNVVQSKYGFLDEKSFRQAFSEIAWMKESTVDSGKWGSYPYCRISAKVKGKKIHMAYVGLNEENGTVLLFRLIVPARANGEKAATDVTPKN